MPVFFSAARRPLFLLLFLLATFQVVNAVVAANAVSGLFRRMEEGVPADGSNVALLLLAIAAAVLIELFRRCVTESLGLGYASEVRLLLFERSLVRPFSGARRRSQGATLLPFVGDLTALRQWSADGIARGASSLLIGTGLCLYIGWRSLFLGAAQFVLFAGMLGLIMLIAYPYGRATRQQRRRRGSLTGFISDRIAGAHTIVAMGGMRREMNAARARTRRMNEASLRRATYSGVIRGVCQGAHMAGSLLLLLAAYRYVGPGGLDSHQVVGLLTLTGILSGCLADIGRAVELAVPGRISLERLTRRLSETGPAVVPDAPGRRCGKSLLKLADVRLPGHDSGFSSEAHAGDIILLQGQSGCGKSLLMATIAGLQPAAGTICIKGRSAARLSGKRKRGSIGIAAPYTPLLLDTLKRNLRYGASGQDEELARHLRGFDLTRFLDAKGDIAGLTVRDGGKDMPLAEVQALQITRAMLGRPAVLLLDDIDDALSPVQADRLAELLVDWPGVVVLASRNPRILKTVNRVWHIDASGLSEATVEADASRPRAAVVPILGRGL